MITMVMSKWFSIHQTSTNYDLVALIIETSEYWPTWSCKERESLTIQVVAYSLALLLLFLYEIYS